MTVELSKDLRDGDHCKHGNNLRFGPCAVCDKEQPTKDQLPESGRGREHASAEHPTSSPEPVTGTLSSKPHHVYDDGLLWSFLRDTMVRGTHIAADTRDKPYEEFSARMDAAASQQVDRFKAQFIRPSDGPAATCTCAMNLGPNAYKGPDCPVHAHETKDGHEGR